MRIIEKHEYKEPEYELTCPKCYTRIAYTKADLGYKGESFDPSKLYVKCPSCGNLCYHTTTEDYYNK